MIDKLQKMEGRLDEDSYVRMSERDDVSKRLKMLFKPEELAEQQASKLDQSEALEKAYETVNEDETTDTTSGLDDESLIKRTKHVGVKQALSSSAKGPMKVVEEGIKSSDEEAE